MNMQTLAVSNSITYMCVTEATRILTTDSLGRYSLLKNNDKKPAGYIVLMYPCHALEWIHIRKTYTACLVEFGFEQLCLVLNEILFAWRYHANIPAF